MLRLAILTLPFFGLCVAQAPPPKARVSGRVINQAGSPLKNATLTLAGGNRGPASPLPPAYTATSDAAGNFSFDDVEPNSYRLLVQRTGYLQFLFAQPDGRVIIPIVQGDQKTIEVKMTAQSFLSGKITDADGEPFPSARISVFRVSRANGQSHLNALMPILAGADGHFSIGDLIAGRYYLAASAPPGIASTGQREVRSKGNAEQYVTTYYPAAFDTSSASVIDVPEGTEVRNIDIPLRKARVFHIYGKIVTPTGAAVSAVTLSLRNPAVNDPIGVGNRIGITDGTFAFNGLLPGVYFLQAQSNPSRELQGHSTVTIADRDIDDATVTLVPALEIPLAVRIADADEQQAQRIKSTLGRFTLTASDGLNDNAMAQSKEDGTWLFRNVGFGTYRIGLGGPDGTYVKSIRFGNQDITTGLLDATAGSAALEAVLSPHAAEVTGIVQDANGQPLSGVTVTLWMPGVLRAGAVDQARSTGTDGMGHFRFGNLRPGEYRIAAWEAIETGLGNIPDFHVKFDDTATSIKLTEDSHETVQPVLIIRAKVDAVAAQLP